VPVSADKAALDTEDFDDREPPSFGNTHV
jgi:hypothetical protein